ncbi:LexA family transcriptional regulator [Antarcticirhabdus aurantiaca]|uniref:Helix-turn-helix domain-containing protein n=1 Tax=Antarcticirhabdus aurantiaca TaxID=2606717 RepID=A0ACD4NRH5_9HYPH|nr:helix-turn-helix domain-containing protein [Jeongeuplla avenae]
MTPTEKIQDILTRKLMRQQALAEHFGVSQSTISRWKNGTAPEGPHWAEIDRLYAQLIHKAENGGSTLPAVARSNPAQIEIVGKGGAGPMGEVVFSDAPGSLGYVNAPPGVTSHTVAIEVQGDSMRGIANDGWLVFYDDLRQAPTPELYGELCVVRMKEGETLVKFLYPGRGLDLYDLESSNAPVMRDVELQWASPVVSIVPRRAAQRMMRANPALDPGPAKF